MDALLLTCWSFLINSNSTFYFSLSSSCYFSVWHSRWHQSVRTRRGCQPALIPSSAHQHTSQRCTDAERHERLGHQADQRYDGMKFQSFLWGWKSITAKRINIWDSEVSTEWSSVPLKISGRRSWGTKKYTCSCNLNLRLISELELTSIFPLMSELELTSFITIVLSQLLCNHNTGAYRHFSIWFHILGRRASVKFSLLIVTLTSLTCLHWIS